MSSRDREGDRDRGDGMGAEEERSILTKLLSILAVRYGTVECVIVISFAQ